MKILNLTQHITTKDQVEAGVIEPDEETKNQIKALLTFNTLPSLDTINDSAVALAWLASELGFESVMIGGAPYLMSSLERELIVKNINVKYSFSERVVIEQIQIDGSVKKTAVFKHVGWIDV